MNLKCIETQKSGVLIPLGNERSTTALHKDQYENIYIQIIGTKFLTLIPPTEAACVNEQELPVASWKSIRCDRCDSGKLCGTSADQIHGTYGVVAPDEPRHRVPFPTWDPDGYAKTSFPTPFSDMARPMRVKLDEGDMLYLPALWLALNAPILSRSKV